MPNTTITSADVVSAFGDYYINSGQNENDIFTRLMEPFGTMECFNVIESDDSILRRANASFSEILQAFQVQFTPKGSVTFEPKEIKLFNVKVDQLFYPDQVKDQWLDFLTAKSLDRTSWPFVRWFMEVYVMKQIKKDLELSAIYGGVRVNPTAGTAGPASASIDGIKKIINTAIAGSTTTAIAMGAPSTDPVTFCTQVEDFVAAIPEVYWQEEMDLNMSRLLRRRYRQGRKKKYNTYYGDTMDLDIVEEFESIKVEGLASHIGSNKIWMTPALNAVMGMKNGANINAFEVEKVDRGVKVYTDFFLGAGFIDDGIVFTNDQDLT